VVARQGERRAAGAGKLLDMLDNIAWIGAVKEVLAERLPAGETCELRAKVLPLLEDGDYERATEMVRRGVEHDRLTRQITDLAEREATLQCQAAKLMMASEAQLSARQVVVLVEQMIGVVCEHTDKATARRIVAEMRRRVLAGNPALALAGSMGAGVQGEEG
jgi:hypothetical protein